MEDKFRELDRLEAEEEMDTRAWMREVKRIMMELPPEELAYRFIRQHFSTENPTDEQYDLFKEWLTNGFREKEKERALQRYFIENFQAESDTGTRVEYQRYADEKWSEIALTLGINPNL